MKIFTFCLSLVALAVACSTGTTKTQSQVDRGTIRFANVEKLGSVNATEEDVIRSIGRPDEITPFRDNTELWTYLEESETGKSQRLNLVINPQTKSLLSASWIPRSGELLSTEKNVLAHFSESNFSSKERGWVADSYSADTTYQDHLKGISFYVTEVGREVDVIGFAPPEERTPAASASPQ